jgi:prepilin peptidase CpaA
MLGWPGFKDGLSGSLAAGGLFFVLFLLGGMGAGDVKLMAAVTAWAGTENVVNLVFAAAVAGGGMAVFTMFYRKRMFSTLLNISELVRHHLSSGMRPHPELNVRDSNALRVPFAPAIAIGTLFCLSRTFQWG